MSSSLIKVEGRKVESNFMDIKENYIGDRVFLQNWYKEVKDDSLDEAKCKM